MHPHHPPPGNASCVWLPYTQMQTARPPLQVASAEGCRIRLSDGRELIDGVSSWWSACHGYRHPHIELEVRKQLETLPHMMFGGMVHAPALKLAERLSAMTPEGLTKVFFSDSGSVAVEVAMKMALQYWRNRGKSGKDRFLCFTDGYHGDTFGAMSISDPMNSMHKAFAHAVIPQFVVDIPTDEYAFAELESLLSGLHKQIAAMVIEPLVQGAGGMRFHSPDVLAELRRLARKHDILFVADEIAVGFARTGHMFACDEAGITPDILCLGKALTGGAIGMGATLAQAHVFEAFLSDDAEAALMHGPTFMANPLACAAANASLDLFESEPRLHQVDAIEKRMTERLKACEGFKGVVDVRIKGAVGVVQMKAKGFDKEDLRARFIARGVWVRPFKDIVYLAPPFTISPEELDSLCDAVEHVIGNFF